MHDFKFLKDFECDLPRQKVDLHLMGQSNGSQTKIFFFSESDKARSFFGSAQNKSLEGKENILILENENVLPRSIIPQNYLVYFLDSASMLDKAEGQHPHWAQKLRIAFYRIFILDAWNIYEDNHFQIPQIYSDHFEFEKILNEFKGQVLNGYQIIYERSIKPRKHLLANASTTLVFNPNKSFLLAEIFDDLKLQGVNAIEIPDRNIPQPEMAEGSLLSVVSYQSFLDTIFNHKIGNIVSFSYEDMNILPSDHLSKAWIIQVLGIKNRVIQTERVMDGVNPIIANFAPSSFELNLGPVFEDLEFFKHSRPTDLVKALGSLVPISKIESVSSTKRLTDIVIMAPSRLTFLKENLRSVLLLTPVLKEFISQDLPFWHLPIIFKRALQILQSQTQLINLYQGYMSLAYMHSIARDLLKISLIQNIREEAKKQNLKFGIFGDPDWKRFYQSDYRGTVTSEEDVYKHLSSSILVELNPSSVFLSQNSLMPKFLAKGASVFGMSPEPTSVPAEFKRFYFEKRSDLQGGLKELLRSPFALPAEARSLLEIFGCQNFWKTAQSAPNEMRKGLAIDFALHARGYESSWEEWAQYIVHLHRLLKLREPRDQVIQSLSPRLSGDRKKDVDGFVNSESSYLESFSKIFPELKTIQSTVPDLNVFEMPLESS